MGHPLDATRRIKVVDALGADSGRNEFVGAAFDRATFSLDVTDRPTSWYHCFVRDFDSTKRGSVAPRGLWKVQRNGECYGADGQGVKS
jgi:hypothetical protein